MIRCPKHGPLLYGTRCVGCDCQHADLEPPAGFVPGTVHMGFDLASGPDKSAHIRATKVAGKFQYSAEELEEMIGDSVGRMAREQADFVRRYRERVEEDILRGYRWEHASDPRPRPAHWNCRCTINPRYGDGEPFAYDPNVEIITDPADQRGVNAKRVGAHP